MGLAGPRGWSWVAVWAGLGLVFGLVLFFLFSISNQTQTLSTQTNKTMHQHECTNMFSPKINFNYFMKQK